MKIFLQINTNLPYLRREKKHVCRSIDICIIYQVNSNEIMFLQKKQAESATWVSL